MLCSCPPPPNTFLVPTFTRGTFSHVEKYTSGSAPNLLRCSLPRRGCVGSSWVEIGEDSVVANLCAAVKVTGAVDTEGPLRRLCGELESSARITYQVPETVLRKCPIRPSSTCGRGFVLQRRFLLLRLLDRFVHTKYFSWQQTAICSIFSGAPGSSPCRGGARHAS